MEGLPTNDKAGNVLLPYTQARLSIRIPPTKNPEEAKNFVVKTLTENPPYNATVTLTNVRAGAGFNAPDYSPVLESALNEAGTIYFGNPPYAIS